MAKPVAFVIPLAAIALVAVISSPAKAQTVESPDIKAALLADIAFQYAALKDIKRWGTVADQALDATQTMNFKCFQANALAKVAGSYWLIGQESQGQRLLAEAIATAQRQELSGCSGSATSPTESLMNRSREYADAGHLDLAIELSSNLGDPITLAELAGRVFEAGQPRRAAGLIDQAIALAETIPTADYRILTLVSAAERLRLAEQPELVRPLLDEALASTSALAQSSDTASMQIPIQLRIVRELAATGATIEAIALLDQTLPQIQTLSDQPYPLDPIIYQVDAALISAELGQRSQAEAILTDTLAAAEAIAEDVNPSQGYALGRVAEAYVKLGNLEQARQIVQSIEPGVEREQAFQQLALAQAEAGDLKSAVALAKASGSRRNTALVAIVRYYLANQQPDQAWALVQAEQVQGILSEVALGFLAAGQPDQAWQIVQTGTLEGFAPDVALAYVKAGQPDQALQVLEGQPLDWLMPAIAGEFAQQRQFDLALEVAQSIDDETYQAQALMAIAQSYSPPTPAQQGFFQRMIANFADFARGVWGDSNREKAIEVLDQALEITLSL